MKYHLKKKYKLKINAFLVKQFKIWCSVFLIIGGSFYILKDTHAEEVITQWDLSDEVSASYADGTLTISGIGEMGSVYEDSSHPSLSIWWKGFINNITKVVIKDNITATDLSYMFYGLRNLNTIDGLDHIDTSHTTNMSNMFNGCKSLIELNVSSFNTSNVTDMSSMFYNCQSLKELDLSNFDTSKVKSMERMFFQCQSLKELDLSHFDTGEVTEMYGMFFQCQDLTGLDVSSFDTGKVTEMTVMFKDCRALTKLDVSNFDTSSVTSINSLFYNCKSLKELDVSNFDTSQVIDMESIFGHCESLTELDLSNFDTSKVTSMLGMFASCNVLTELDVSSFDTSKVANMTGVFNGCQALTELDLSSFNTSKATSMESMFYDCRALTELDLSNFDTGQVTSIYNMFEQCQSLVKVKGLSISNENCNVFLLFTSTPNLSQVQVKTKVSLMIPYIDSTHRWYDDQNNQLISNENNAVIPLSETYVTYTLKPGITYDINYNLDGGTLPEEAKDQFEILDEYELPIPVRSGYIFDGWYDKDNNKLTKIDQYTSKDITINAKWIEKTALKANDFTVKLSSDIYTGEEITYTILSSRNGIGIPQIMKIEKEGKEVNTIKEAGTYKLTFDVSEGEKYLGAKGLTLSFTIKKKANEPIITPDIPVSSNPSLDITKPISPTLDNQVSPNKRNQQNTTGINTEDQSSIILYSGIMFVGLGLMIYYKKRNYFQ